jgi:ribosomal-protein-alanine N-acetyltransferase
MTNPAITTATINTETTISAATNLNASSDRLDLVPMSLELMEALLDGDLQSAQEMVGYRIPADWPQVMESVLQFRIPLARAHPDATPLLLLAMVLRADPEVVVGRLGFHGPVDDDGMLEIGYEVFPAHRRQGFAREAVVAMFRWAQRDPAVLRFRASVSPGNAPSRNLVTGLGFVEVGSQWDDEDGEETLFERPVGQISWAIAPLG